MLAKLALSRVSPLNVLACCLCAIAVVQPLAVLNAGFWLSFVAVLLLIITIAPWASREGFFRQLSAVQWHLWIGLSLPLLALAGQLTWLAPWVNLVAVPWLSLLTIPLAMLGTALFAVLPRWAEWLWLAADVSLRPLWLLLDVWPATWDFFQFADGFFLVGGDYLWARHQRNYTAKGHPSPLVAGVASANAAGGSPRATHTANYRARRG